jgi:hypothetical protein
VSDTCGGAYPQERKGNAGGNGAKPDKNLPKRFNSHIFIYKIKNSGEDIYIIE